MTITRIRWFRAGVLAALVATAPSLMAGQATSPNVACVPGASTCATLTLSFVDSKTGLPTALPSGYRWLVQVDTTFNHHPGQPAAPHVNDPNDNGYSPHDGESLSVSYHASYAPPIAAGDTTGADGADKVTPPAVDSSRRYFVTIMPYGDGYNMGGAPVVIGPDGTTATATVALSPNPLPTSQISVLIFEDNSPINDESEIPEERGLAGFNVQVLDTGGTLGITGGLVSNDAFGHKLGTEYALDANGDPIPSQVITEGTGLITTNADGTAIVKYLPPGRWAVVAVPPTMPPGQEWHQTSTLEGMPDIEAFVKAKEPAVFVEFGPPGYHVFIGFVNSGSFKVPVGDPNGTPRLSLEPAPNGRVTLKGRITNNHTSRPPDYHFYSGQPIKNAWVGLNNLAGGAAGEGLGAWPCDPETGEFSIPGVPAGSAYQLVVWDEPLDNVFAFADASVPSLAGGAYNLGDIPVFSWFSHAVFDFYYDTNGNGVRNPSEPGLKGQNVNLRWRDGSIYQSKVTDDSGRADFSEVFPFFNWIVSEFDFSRWGTTGLTVRVDDGGPIDPSDPDSMGGLLNPQPQPIAVGGDEETSEWNTQTNNNKSRVERISSVDDSLIATEAFQVFLGQTVHMEYAKHIWGDTNPLTGGVMTGMMNGGIAGGVWYDSTRESDTPRDNAAETWCPGVPRVVMNLYQEDPRAATDPAYHGKIADLNGNGAIDLSDVDNWPFGWMDGGAKGPEDVKRSSVGGPDVFDPGDTFQAPDPSAGGAPANLIGSTTSWDDAQPHACVGDVFSIHGAATDCYDGLRNFNQSRPGSSDGFYGFGGVNGPHAPQLPAGNYIVEAVAPPGYFHTAEESKNVNFGQGYGSPDLILAECVGDLHVVPTCLELFQDPSNPSACDVPTMPIVSGKNLPFCDRKLVSVSTGQNAAADFFIYTKVPVAGNAVGITTDDMTNEFDPNAPNFGEKYAPPHMPISIQDWTGQEISRIYTDEYGAYNALVPSSYSANIPVPSGYAPNMLVICMNHPGPIPDPDHPGQTMMDPYFLRQYSQFCYNWSFMPGKTSYLDTPVVPVAAFTGPQQSQLDCELPDHTPKIYSATGPKAVATAAGAPGSVAGSGPWLPGAYSNGSAAGRLNKLTLISQGSAVPVMNPLYDTTNAAAFSRTVLRDFGFGSPGAGAQVKFRDVNANFLTPPADTILASSCATANSTGCVESWTPDMIVIRPSVPGGGSLPSGGRSYELVVTRSNGSSTVTGVTVTLGGANPLFVAPNGSIQAALDAATAGRVVIVPPGRYTELLKMWKPTRLQGWGEGSTTLDASASPSERIQSWNQWADAFFLNGAHANYLLPGQPTGAGLPEPTLFATEQAPSIIVLGPSSGTNAYRQLNSYPNARIDGFRVTGGSTAGAIFVNGYADFLQISNNHIVGNQGFYGGGIRIGHPSLIQTVGGVDQYVSGSNDNVKIAYNQITENAGLAGAGGGISLCAGSAGYQVTRNWICGNYTNGSGGGIGHLGLSNNGQIDHNAIIFNQTFDQSTTPGGGGIFIGGDAPLGAVSPGSGTVTVNANLIQGNLAGAGDGGGLRAEFVNGADIAAIGALLPGNSIARQTLQRLALRTTAYKLHLYNNMISNNMAGLAAGGISLQDVALADIVDNTVANNDAVATAGSAFTNPNQSTPRPAGVVSYAHTGALNTAFAPFSNAVKSDYGVFSSPRPFANNIVLGSRSFYAQVDPNTTNAPAPFLLTPAPAPVGFASDLSVLNCAACALQPTYSVLATAVPGNNVTGNPAFLATYLNGARSALTPFGFTTDVQMAVAFDEGGNFIDVRFGPLTLNDPTAGNALFGNYHIGAGSAGGTLGQSLTNLYVIGQLLPIPDALRNDFDGAARPTLTRPDIGADQR